jgi:hypothetical protein
MRPMQPYIDFGAVLAGVGAGVALVLLVLLTAGPLRLNMDGLLPVVMRALFIYVPTGYVTGARVRKTNRKLPSDRLLAPAVAHAILAGGLLTLIHAALLWLTSAGITPGIEWFVAEALSAAVMSAVGGIFGGRQWATVP